MKEEDSLTANEMARLADWLKSKGMTSDEIIDCIHYIAGRTSVLTEEKKQVPVTATNEPET